MPFSHKTLEFLAENRERNSKEWYHEHIGELKEYVEKPFAELISVLLPVVCEADPYINCDPRIAKGISRVYRDTRFSYDKMLFRSSAWCVLMRQKKLYNGLPAFYVDISQTRFSWGCGYYQADRQTLDNMRTLITEGSELWSSAYTAYKAQDVFMLEGEKYKKHLIPGRNDEENDWLDRKNICLTASSEDFEKLYSPSFASETADDFRKIFAVYKFMSEAELSKQK